MTNFVNAWPVDEAGAIVTSGSGRSVAGYLPEGTMPVGEDGGVLGISDGAAKTAPTVCFLGDSLTNLGNIQHFENDNNGWKDNSVSSFPNIGYGASFFIQNVKADARLPTQSVTFEWDGDRLMRVSIGADVGDWVDVFGGGHYVLPIKSLGYGYAVQLRWSRRKLTAQSDTVSCTGGGGVTGFSGASHSGWALLGADCGFTALNRGITGDQTADILYRIDNSLDKSADIYVCMMGINDVNNSVPLSVTKERMKQIYDKMQATGKQCVLLTTMPSGVTPNSSTDLVDGTAYSAITALQGQKRTAALRRFVMSEAASRGWACVDAHDLMLDPYSAGQPKTSLIATDTLHYNGIGAFEIGLKVAEELKRSINLIPNSVNENSSDVYDAADNPTGSMYPIYSGTSGTGDATGSIPTGFQLQRTGGANLVTTSAYVTRAEGGNWLSIKSTKGASQTAAETITLRQAAVIPAGNFSVGDLFEFVGEFQLSASAGAVVKQVEFKLYSGGYTVISNITLDSCGDFAGKTIRRKFRTLLRVPVGATNLEARILQTLDGSTPASGWCQIDLYGVAVRKVIE